MQALVHWQGYNLPSPQCQYIAGQVWLSCCTGLYNNNTDGLGDHNNHIWSKYEEAATLSKPCKRSIEEEKIRSTNQTILLPLLDIKQSLPCEVMEIMKGVEKSLQ